MSGAFRVVDGSGPLAEAFASARTDWPAEPTLTWWRIDRPTLVLGSGQPDSVVDAVAAARAGVDVVRRASGGGAVLLGPDHVIWCDVTIPPGHPRWDDDIVAAAGWVGDRWMGALAAVGVEGRALTRHRGGLVRTAWSDLVCFAGTGPGEVLLDGRKVVGISQRRSRRGARFQIAVLREWDVVGICALLALDDEARRAAAAALRDVAIGVGADAAALRDAFSAQLG